jgi:lysozyme
MSNWPKLLLIASVTVMLEQHQSNALVSFTFNLGQGALAQTTLLKLLNAKRYGDVGPQFLRWNNGPNGSMPGLTRRRAAEKAMFKATGIHAVGMAA